jgi:hypothetical protein
MVTIAPSERFTSYAPVTPTTAFPVNFPIFDPDDVKLLLDGVDYPAITVSATFVEGVSTDAVINVVGGGLTGDVVVVGDRAPRRTDQYQNGRALNISDHNYSLNRLTIESQEQARDTARAFKVALGQTAGSVTVGAEGDSLVYDEFGNVIPGPALGSVPGLVQEAIDAAEAAEDAAAAAIAAAALVGFRTYFVVDQTSHKALDTTIIKSVHELASNSLWSWTLGDFAARIALDTTGALFRKADAIPAATGAWVRAYAGRVNAKWFGTGQAAIVAALAVADDVEISDAYSFTSNATLASGKRLVFRDGGLFNVATAVTVTIRGEVLAARMRAQVSGGPNKIFNCTGTGAVVGLSFVMPEWWGAVGGASNGVGTNDQPALQAAHDCVAGSYVTAGTSGARPTISLRRTGYGLGATWFLRPSAFVDLKVEGAGSVFGTRFEVLAAFAGTTAIIVDGQTIGSTDAIMHFTIGGFSIQFTTGVSNAACLVGFQIGTPGKDIIGTAPSSVHDLYVANSTRCIGVRNARLVVWDRVAAWAGAGASFSLFIDVSANQFTGDMEFRQGCQFVATNSATAVAVQIENRQTYVSGGNNQVAGIRFMGVIAYGGAPTYSVYGESGARIHDIFWGDGSQIDAQTTGHFQITANGANTQITQLSWNQFWSFGDANGTAAYWFRQLSGGVIKGVQINNCVFANFTERVIQVDGCTGFTLTNNQFQDIANAADYCCIFNSGSLRLMIAHNQMLQANTVATVNSFIVLASGTNQIHCRDNMATGIATATVNDLSGAITKSVGDNL